MTKSTTLGASPPGGGLRPKTPASAPLKTPVSAPLKTPVSAPLETPISAPLKTTQGESGVNSRAWKRKQHVEVYFGVAPAFT